MNWSRFLGNFALISAFTLPAYLTSTLLILDEIAVFKFLNVFAFKRMALINDAFIATFLGSVNVVIASVIAGSHFVLEVVDCDVTASFLRGSKPFCSGNHVKTASFL